jgi:hypothetical protein
LAGPFFGLDVVTGRADEGSLSRLGRSPTAERPEGLDGDPVRCMLVEMSG